MGFYLITPKIVNVILAKFVFFVKEEVFHRERS